MNRATPPTLDDVAQLAGVSTATISRALNTPEKVAETTRSRIHKAIDSLGYTPNFGGQVLASNRTRTIGAIIPSLANSMFASGLQAFQERLTQSGMTLLVASSGYDPGEELRQIRALMGRGADGLMLVGTDRPEETRAFLAQRAVPHVLTWCFVPDGPAHYAGFRSYDAAANLTQHVLDLGHKRIAVIAAHTAQNDRARDRLAGVVDTVAKSDARIVRVVETSYGVDEGRAAFDIVLQSGPTVVICANDVLAAGAIGQARQRGISVPDDVSVTGFDDTEIATIAEPPLTTIEVPHRLMGHAAAEILMKLIEGEDNVPSTDLGTRIIHRGSLAAPKTG